ncbi:unnamed protein product, partial [Ectocarpus sp. 12 AP-2014]
MQTPQGHTSEEGSSSDETANVTLDRAHSSTVSLTITLPSVPSTFGAGAFKTGVIADLEEARQGSNAPTAVVWTPPSSQRHRRKNSPTPAWYAVGASLGAILSPHKPSRTDSRRPRAPSGPSPHLLDDTKKTKLAYSSFEPPMPWEKQPGDATAVAPAPMHGQATAGHRSRHHRTAAAKGERTRDGTQASTCATINASPARRKRQSLTEGLAPSATGRQSSIIPYKSHHVPDVDAETVLASSLSVRRPETTAVPIDGSDEMRARRQKGVQAVCRWPVVPRPCSPRSAAECHPWDFSLDRFIVLDTPRSTAEQPWRLEGAAEETEATDLVASAANTGFVQKPGPTPHFPTENLRASRWHRSARQASSLSAFGRGDGSTDVPGTERVVVVTAADAKLDQRGEGEIGGHDEARTPLLRKRRVRALMKTLSALDALRPQRESGSERPPNRTEECDGGGRLRLSGIRTADIRLSSDASSGARWGQSVYDPGGGGDESNVNGGGGGPGSSKKLSRDENDEVPDGIEPPASSTDGVQTSQARAITRERTMLGEAGAGEIFVADGVGKVKRRTVSRKAVSKRGKKAAKGRTTAKGSKTDSNSSDENQDSSARKRKSSEEKPWQRSTGRSRSMTVVDVAMAAMQKKREARLKSRAMLKNARGLILKGRMNRAHAALDEAVACNEAPHLLVILSELRARVRAALGRWDEAGEDVRVALRGLEQGEGVGVDDMDSDEERAEEAKLSGKKRWRAIVNRAVLRRRYAKASFAAVVSTFLAARRGLRARVMLVAAKCLAQQEKLEAAIVCTREIRELADRRSALPGGSSGVASLVTHEAYKLEIQWLQDTGQFAAAVLAAREMDAEVKRHINDQHLQSGGGGDQEIVGESRSGDGEPNLGSILFQDVQSEDDDQGETYEAAVWAKVAIADLATRNMEQRHEKDKKAKGTGGGTGGAFGERQASLRKKAKRARRMRAIQRGKPGGGKDDGAATHDTPDAQNRVPSAAAVAMSSLTTSVKYVVIDTGDGDKQRDDNSGGQSTTVGLSDVGTHKTHTEEQGEQTASAVKPATTVMAASAAETTDSAAPTKSYHQGQGQQQEQRCLEAAEHARSGGEKGDNTPPANGGHDQVCDAEGKEQTSEKKKEKTHVTKQSTKVGAVAAMGSDGSMRVNDSAVGGGHGDTGKSLTDGDHQKKHTMGDKDGPGKARLDKENNKEGEGEGTGEESDDSTDRERTQGKALDDGKRGEQPTAEGGNDQKNVVGKEQESAVMEEETEGEETEEEDSESESEEEEEEEEAESLAKTDEDNRCNLEAAIDSLQLLLGDERMAWRADVRTPGVLATAIEKLADLSQRRANDDRADKKMDLPGTCSGAGAATEEQPIKKRPSTRQEILQSGEESLKDVFAVLEGKLSSLVAEWKPRWKSHCQAKNIPIRREGGGGVGGGWNKMRAKIKRGGKGGSRRSLPDVVHGILVSAAEAGVDIEAHANGGVKPAADVPEDGVGVGGTNSAETSRPGSNHGGGMTNYTKKKPLMKLPKELETLLTHLLKVLHMIPGVLERRAHLAELAGEDPTEIISLLEAAIFYLYLPRTSPPGGPPVFGPMVFGAGSGKGNSINSFHAATLAAVSNAAGKKKAKRKTTGQARSTKAQQQPMAKPGGERTKASSPSPSRSPPRHRASPSPSAATGPKNKLQQAVTAPKAAATEAATAAAAKAASLLLPWDTESLAGLLAVHRAMAAALFRLERNLKLNAGTSAKPENQTSSRVSIATETGVDGHGDRDHGGHDHADDASDDHGHLLNRCRRLLERADASLTVALAAAGVEVGLGALATTLNNATPRGSVSGVVGGGNKSPRGGISGRNDHAYERGRPRMASRTTPSTLNISADDGDDNNTRLNNLTNPLLPAKVEITVMPMPERDADVDQVVPDHHDRSSSLHDGERRDADGKSPRKKSTREEEPRRRNTRSDAASGAPVAAATADAGSETMAELYAMRCAAREGLGLVEDACIDCREALAAAPDAPKLWAKAASLALQSASGSGGKGQAVTDIEGVSRQFVKANYDYWAREAVRLATGLLSLCPRSYHGFILRGQAAEKAGQHDRAMRDYSRAQHLRPWSSTPALLRARLDSRLSHLDKEGGGTGERYAVEAIDMITRFLSLPPLSVDTGTTRSPGNARLRDLAVVWWKGRLKELERSYGQATAYFELVYEKDPTIEHLNHLASAYLGSKQPGK